MTVENSLPTPPSTTYSEVKDMTENVKSVGEAVQDVGEPVSSVDAVAQSVESGVTVAEVEAAKAPEAEPEVAAGAADDVTSSVDDVTPPVEGVTVNEASVTVESGSVTTDEVAPAAVPTAPVSENVTADVTAATPTAPVTPAPVYPPGTAYPRAQPKPKVPVPAPVEPVAVFTRDQQKHAFNMLRSLKKNKNSGPFYAPVDAVALLIPDYYRIVTEPIELQTIEAKVVATGKAITAANKNGRIFGIDYTEGTGAWEGLSGDVYRTVEEFKRDVDLIWANCYKFNGTASAVSAMAQAMQEHADRLYKNMPVSKPLLPSDTQSVLSRPTASTPQPSSAGFGGEPSRPRRDIHAPPRDLPYSVEPKKLSRSDKVLQEQLRFAKEVVREMFKKVHETYAFPFLQPVDLLAYPRYLEVVRRPMDFGTIKNRLEKNEYELPLLENVERDVKQIFDNCYAFNPLGTPVHEMGRKLEAVFNRKWADQPDFASLARAKSTRYEDEFEDEYYSDSDDDINISAMEKQVAALQATIESLKRRSKKSGKRKSGASIPSVKKSKSNVGTPVNRPRKSNTGELVTYDMKRELANKIVKIDGDKLTAVIEIIKSGRPDLIGTDNQEIELDIDTLDQNTLYKLFDFVCGGSSDSKPKAKRRALDEMKESQKIEQLEAQLRQFEKPATQFDEDQASSDSSDDDSSDNDSD